jgi:hypothetical protein
MKLKLKEFISIEAKNAIPISACYYLLETEPAANIGSILRDFVTGKLPTAFDSSISIHFMHKSELYTSALLISSILSL